jgi:hypothetical protein
MGFHVCTPPANIHGQDLDTVLRNATVSRRSMPACLAELTVSTCFMSLLNPDTPRAFIRIAKTSSELAITIWNLTYDGCQKR